MALRQVNKNKTPCVWKAYEAVPECCIVMNERYEIMSFNSYAEQEFGYGMDEIKGECVSKIIPEFTAKTRVNATVKQVLAYRRDGTMLFVDVSLNRVQQGSSAVYVVLITNSSTSRIKREKSKIKSPIVAKHNKEKMVRNEITCDSNLSRQKHGMYYSESPLMRMMVLIVHMANTNPSLPG
jgi:PAS domain S-box-containing protein